MKGATVSVLKPDALLAASEALQQAGGRLEMAYALDTRNGVELRYVTTPGAGQPFGLWCVQPESEIPSLARVWPLVSWYEREITDLYGLRFTDSPNERPLLPDAALNQPARAGAAPSNGTGWLPEIEANAVQVLPFGPIRADVMESAQFTFGYIGEHILHYDPQLFLKYRGMERRFETVGFAHAVVLAERVSGVGSFCHALAFCEAVERAADCAVPVRAHWLRTLLAELERIYNHLHYLGHLCHTTTLKVGEAQGKLLEEQAKHTNGRLTGSRLLRGLLVPGGLRRDLQPDDGLSASLEALQDAVKTYTRLLGASESHLDRLIGTGPLSQEVAFDQGATGPVERASGVDRDLRRDHPYAAYGEIHVEVAVQTEGDVNARAAVRMAEIGASFAIIDQVLQRLHEGPVRVPCSPPPLAEGLGWAEGPRGSVFYAVHFGEDGALRRVKIRSPSLSNWRAFPSTVHDSNMMDYAINEASFGLTVAGCAR